MSWHKEWMDAQGQASDAITELREISKVLHKIFGYHVPLVSLVDHAMLNLVDAKINAEKAIGKHVDEDLGGGVDNAE